MAQTPPRDYDDAHLWKALEEARQRNDEPEVRRCRAAIVDFHMGYWKRYAVSTHREKRTNDLDEYIQEVVLIATEQVDRYDPARGTPFPSFCRAALQRARQRLEAQEGDFSTGAESRRIHKAARRINADRHAAGLPELTAEELSPHISLLHGKPISPARVQGVLDTPGTVRGDERIAGGEKGDTAGVLTYFDTVTDDVTPEQEVLREEAADAARELVRQALSSLHPPLTPLDRAILVHRLMMPDSAKVPFGDLAREYGSNVGRVQAAERALLKRLRRALGLPDDGADGVFSIEEAA